MIMKVSNDKAWNVHGINMISSDSSYQKIKAVIEEGNVTEKRLQTVTGHRLPIDVNIKKRTINFHTLL